MNENDEIIDPKSWTQKELIKHLYREVLEIKRGQEELVISLEKRQKEGLFTINENQKDFESRIRKLEVDLNKRKGLYAAAAAIIAFIVSILQDLITK